MAKKRERTGEDDKRDVLLYLCEHGESTVTEMAKKLKINKGQISRAVHTHDLEPHLDIKIGSGGTHLISFVCDDPHTLWEVIVKSLKHSYMQQTFMKSKIYRSWIPELVDTFNRSFLEIGLTTIDIEYAGTDPKFVEHLKKNTSDGLLMHHHREHIKQLEHLIQSGELDDAVVAGFKKQLASERDYNPDPPYTFSDSEFKDITKALGYNWTMLRFIVYYLSADDAIKHKLMTTLATDTRLATTSGANVAATGWMRVYIKKFIADNGVALIGVVPDECQHFLDMGVDRTITNSMLRYAVVKTTKHLLGRETNELQTMWFAEWFAELDVIRDRYPFLFD